VKNNVRRRNKKVNLAPAVKPDRGRYTYMLRWRPADTVITPRRYHNRIGSRPVRVIRVPRIYNVRAGAPHRQCRYSTPGSFDEIKRTLPFSYPTDSRNRVAPLAGEYVRAEIRRIRFLPAPRSVYSTHAPVNRPEITAISLPRCTAFR